MTIGYTRGERIEYMQRKRDAVMAQAVRDALLFALIFHAVTTVLFAPRKARR